MQSGRVATMSHVNARTAARLAGKDRSTILRALESGRLSATKDDRGQWLIDPAELERVYGQLHLPDAEEEASGQDAYVIQVASLTKEVELLREMLADARVTNERDRRSFNEERTFLRGLVSEQSGQLKLLTDQRERAEQERLVAAAPRPSLLARMFGRR